MTGALIGDKAGSSFLLSPTTYTRSEIVRPNAHFTQNILLSAALCELLYYTDTPAKTWVEKKLRAREIASNYKKYANFYPELLSHSESLWAAQAAVKKAVNTSPAAAVAALPCAYVFSDVETAAEQARLCCSFIYNTEAAKSCAAAVVSAVFLLFHGESVEAAAKVMSEILGREAACDYDEMRDRLITDKSPQTVTAAAYCAFARSWDFASAVRLGCACGTHSDVIAAVSGALAEAYYAKIPDDLRAFAYTGLDETLKRPIERFEKKYCVRT